MTDLAPPMAPQPPRRWSFEPRVVWSEETRERARAPVPADPVPAPPRSMLDGETCRLELARAIDWKAWDECLQDRLSRGWLDTQQAAHVHRMRERLTMPRPSSQGLLGLVKRAASAWRGGSREGSRAESLDATAEAIAASNTGFPHVGENVVRHLVNDWVVRGGVGFGLEVTVRALQLGAPGTRIAPGLAPWRILRGHFVVADEGDRRLAMACATQLASASSAKFTTGADSEAQADMEQLLAGLAYACSVPDLVDRVTAHLGDHARAGHLTELECLLIPDIPHTPILFEVAIHKPGALLPYAWRLLQRLGIQAVPVLCEMFARFTDLRARSQVASVLACVESPEVAAMFAPLVDHPGMSVAAQSYFERAPHLAVLALHAHAACAAPASDTARMLLTRLLALHPDLHQAVAPAVGDEASQALAWLRQGLEIPDCGGVPSVIPPLARTPRVRWSREAEDEAAACPGHDVEPVVPRSRGVEECRRTLINALHWDLWDRARTAYQTSPKTPAGVVARADAGRTVLTSRVPLGDSPFVAADQAMCAVLASSHGKECVLEFLDLWVAWQGVPLAVCTLIQAIPQMWGCLYAADLWAACRGLFRGSGKTAQDELIDRLRQLREASALLTYARSEPLDALLAWVTQAPDIIADALSAWQQPTEGQPTGSFVRALVPLVRDGSLATAMARVDARDMRPTVPVLVRNLGNGAVRPLALLLEKSAEGKDAEARRAIVTSLARIESLDAAAVLAPLHGDADVGLVAGEWCARRPDLAFAALHGLVLKDTRASESSVRWLLRFFRRQPQLLEVLRPTATRSEQKALDRLARRLGLAPDASPDQLPAVLANPPWRQERAGTRKQPTVVKDLAPLPFDESMAWLPGQQERLQKEARLYDAPRRSLVKWNEGLKLTSVDDIQSTGAALVARFGLEALPGFLACGEAHPAAAAPVLARVCSPRVAPIMAAALVQSKQARRVAQTWIFEFAEAAATGLLPRAVGPAGKQRTAAQQALRLLHVRGRGSVVADVARRYGDGVVAAWAVLADDDGTGDVPARLPSLPLSWDPSAGPRPLLRGREHALPVSAVTDLALMLKFSPVDPPYAGLARVKEACDGDSLHEFAWDLFECWIESGGPPAEQWMLMALGHLGSDETARRLTAHIEEWPVQGFHARTLGGLDCLLMIGSEVALMQLQRMAEKSRKSVADHAHKRLQLLAAVRDLGEDDLSDRLVPRLGLDDDSARVLDFGARTLTIGFDEQLQPYVRDADGKRLASLPKGGRLDDADKVAAAHASWKTLKKDVRQVASVQLHRLELAMCGRRRWRPASFMETLAVHPLMRHPVRGLVWGLYGAEGAMVATFRVAEDGTLADPRDCAWSLPEGADDEGWCVGIPHPVTMGAEDLATWGEVWSDYALMQPFAQLARTTHRATDEERASLFLRRTEGWPQIPSPRVLGLERLGWTKGPTGSRGTIEWFEKPIPGTQMQFHLYMDPGVMVSMSDAWEGEQRLGEVDVHRVGCSPRAVYRQGASTPTACLRFGDVPLEDFSEMVRDVLTLRS